MKIAYTRPALALAAAVAGLSLAAARPGALAFNDASQVVTPESTIEDWPTGSRQVARVMIEKYGEPSRFGENALVWFDNGPWQRTVVHRRGWPRLLGMTDKNYLEQAISYEVPAPKIEALKDFDRRVEVDKAAGELSSRSDSEATNYLALNLADEIVSGKRSVTDARDFLRKTERLSRSGKSSPYLEGFVFEASRTEPAAVDMPESTPRNSVRDDAPSTEAAPEAEAAP